MCGSLGELDSPGNTGGRCAGTADQRGQQQTGQRGEDYSVDKWFAVKHGLSAFRFNKIDQGRTIERKKLREGVSAGRPFDDIEIAADDSGLDGFQFDISRESRIHRAKCADGL